MPEIVTTTYTPDEIRIFGEDNDYKAIPVTLVDTQTALSAGAPLGRITASGKYKVYNNGASDGSEVFSGFLCGPANPAGEGRDVQASMWISGYFDHSKVVALGFDANALTDCGGRVVPGRNLLVVPG